jgi:hypothetical protein
MISDWSKGPGRKILQAVKLHAALFIAAILVSGCDILHVKEYRVIGVAPSSMDATRLKSVLQDVADKSGLKDRTAESSATNTLFYARDEYKGGVSTLNARFVHDDVMLQLLGGYRTPPAYRKCKRLLPSALSTEFGSRFAIEEQR